MRIYSRAEWGARYADGSKSRPLPAGHVFLHHSVTPAPAQTLAAESTAMRSLESIGQSRFGAGISYNFAVMPSGRVYAGVSVGRVGAHTKGYNTNGIGIVLVGNYDKTPLNAAQRKAVSDLLRYLRGKGHLTNAARLRGHSDVSATACPGAKAYALIGLMESDSRKVVDVAAKNVLVQGFVRPDKAQAAIEALKALGIRAYVVDSDAARITRRNPEGSAQ